MSFNRMGMGCCGRPGSMFGGGPAELQPDYTAAVPNPQSGIPAAMQAGMQAAMSQTGLQAGQIPQTAQSGMMGMQTAAGQISQAAQQGTVPAQTGMAGLQAGQMTAQMPQDAAQAAAMQQKSSLIKQIYEASFAMDDILLYLDTHRDSAEALQYYKSVAAMRKNAVEAYESQFGPLFADQVSGNSWSWVTDVWPWEGGF